jgi:hypothetical protein
MGASSSVAKSVISVSTDSDTLGTTVLSIEPGKANIVTDGTEWFRQYGSVFGTKSVLYDIKLLNLDVYGTFGPALGTDPIEEDGGIVFFCAGGKRIAGYVGSPGYAFAGNIFVQEASLCPVEGPYHMTATRTYFQFWDLVYRKWCTFLEIRDDGTVNFPYGIEQITTVS